MPMLSKVRGYFIAKSFSVIKKEVITVQMTFEAKTAMFFRKISAVRVMCDRPKWQLSKLQRFII